MPLRAKEMHLTTEEAEDLHRFHDLKRFLAFATPSKPSSPCLARLIGPDGLEINDDSKVCWELLEQGLLQYVLMDVMSVTGQFDPSHVVLGFPEDSEQLLHPDLVITVAHKIFKRVGRDPLVGQKFYTAWATRVLNLPDKGCSVVDSDGRTLLWKMLNLLRSLHEAIHDPSFDPDEDEDQWYIGEDFLEVAQKAVVSTTIQLVKTKETIFHSFPAQSNAMRILLWTFIQDKLALPRGYGQLGGLFEGRGADLMLALIEEGLPRWYWAGHFGRFDDNLLQYILESAFSPNNIINLSECSNEGGLCLALARRLRLEELCHQNVDGKNALYYAERIAIIADTARAYPVFRELGVWIQLRDMIRVQMEAHVIEFQGSLLELAALTGSVRAALEGNSLPAFDQQLWQRAAVLRLEWLRSGWRFARFHIDGQISEVISWHFHAVRPSRHPRGQ
eukprot:g925.t1